MDHIKFEKEQEERERAREEKTLALSYKSACFVAGLFLSYCIFPIKSTSIGKLFSHTGASALLYYFKSFALTTLSGIFFALLIMLFSFVASNFFILKHGNTKRPLLTKFVFFALIAIVVFLFRISGSYWQ